MIYVTVYDEYIESDEEPNFEGYNLIGIVMHKGEPTVVIGELINGKVVRFQDKGMMKTFSASTNPTTRTNMHETNRHSIALSVIEPDGTKTRFPSISSLARRYGFERSDARKRLKNNDFAGTKLEGCEVRFEKATTEGI